MDFLRIQGGRRLDGECMVGSAKNAVLPIMAAAILTDDQTTLLDCPGLSDIKYMGDILRTLGCRVTDKTKELSIDPQGISSYEMPDGLAKKIRSSIFMLGPILSRFRKATVTYPGGCEIGMRPIDLHIKGLKQLGVKVREEGGMIYCDGADMRAATIHFDYPSVGATENAMMAAVQLRGKTYLHNVAREPEIVDLQHFINAMGGRVSGAGTHTICIEGVNKLHGTVYRPMPDRIVAGTLLAATAITGGHIKLSNVPCQDMYAVFSKLQEMGCIIGERGTVATLNAPKQLKAFSQLQTQPHPGFPTDMQAQMLALATVAKGTSIVVENVFESRFTHAGDLNRMGGNVVVNGRMAIVQGVDTLYGSSVSARDLRGGAALALAGLAADGETLLDNVHYIDRGYERFEEMLAALGADIRREKTAQEP